MQAPERARPTARTGQRLLLLTLALLFPQLWTHVDAEQANSGSAATDRAALEALYHATDGPNWKTSTNWLSGDPLSAWHGVLKTTPSGRVQVLSLNSNRLHGPVPVEIANLTELELLNLNNNDLEGILPTGLMNLTRLHTLWIGQVDLCAPRDPAFEAWLETIYFRGMLCPPRAQSVIDVAVFYTPVARDFAGGGVAEIESLIDSMVAETNLAYAASGVNQRLSLVAAREVAHTEGDAPTDQERLVDKSDGTLDGVHAIRDEVAADVVMLLGDYDRGFADVMFLVSPDFEDRALGVASVSDVRWFAHELGHIMGLRHDRHLECHDGHCSRASFEDAYGYVNQEAFEAGAPESARWYTIMAYGAQCVSDGLDCEPVLRFSNPDRLWPPGDGDPMGIPGIEHAGTVLGPANAARALNRTRETVSQFRMDANAPPTFTSSSAFSAAENQTAAGTVRASDSNAEDDVTGYVISGGVDWGFFSIGSTSGKLTFDAAPNFEDPEDANTDGSYLVTVRASSGTGSRVKTAEQSIRVTVTDVRGEAPSAPAPPTVSAASATSLNVRWSAPDNAGPAITDYDVRYRTASPAGNWTEVTDTSITARSTTLSDLAENTEYQVQVRAANADGEGDWSASGIGRSGGGGGSGGGSGGGGSRNRPPVVTEPLGAQVLEIEGSVRIDATEHFRDPERRTMTFEAESADVSVATVEVDGSIVTVGGIAHGVTAVTVTAVDHRRLRASQGFEVSVGRQVSFASAEVSAPEGGTATLTVVINRPRDVATSLDYVVGPDDDPATADADADDHDGAGGTVVIAARAMEATIALAVHDDTDIEPPRETFAVTLQATEAQLQDFGLGVATVRVTIDEGVCDRTRQVRNALRRSLPCAAVSESDLAGVRTLDLSNAGLAGLRSADFSGLRELRALDMSGNSLASLPDGVFAGLGALAEVRLQDNPGSPFTLRVELARTDGPASAPSPARLAARVRQGAPFPMRTGLKAVGGALSSDTSVVTTGMTESAPVSVARTSAGATRVELASTPLAPDTRCGRFGHYLCYRGFATAIGAPLVLFKDPPEVVGSVSATDLAAENDSMRIALSELFAAADGRPLRYAARSSDPGLAGAEVRGGVLIVVSGEDGREGTATITVTATDADGLSATLTFEVTLESMPRGFLRGWRRALIEQLIE